MSDITSCSRELCKIFGKQIKELDSSLTGWTVEQELLPVVLFIVVKGECWLVEIPCGISWISGV